MVFNALGVHKGNEKTYAYGAAIATQAHGFNIQSLLEDGRDLKSYVRSMTPKLRGPEIYPSDPEVIRRDWPSIFAQAYGADEAMYPVPSKRANEHREIVLGMMPCRSSKAGSRALPRVRSTPQRWPRRARADQGRGQQRPWALPAQDRMTAAAVRTVPPPAKYCDTVPS